MKRRLLTIVAILIFLTIIITILIVGIANNISNEINKEKGKYEQYIGDKFIIDNDTLLIIDYSMINETFTLSNGKKVSYSLIESKNK